MARARSAVSCLYAAPETHPFRERQTAADHALTPGEQSPIWGGVFTHTSKISAETSFALVSLDEEAEPSRRSTARLRRGWLPSVALSTNWKSPSRCRPGSSRRRCRPSLRSTTRGDLRRGSPESAGVPSIFLTAKPGSASGSSWVTFQGRESPLHS